MLLAAGWLVPGSAEAAVVVVSNRGKSSVAFDISAADRKVRQYELAPGESLPVPVAGDVGISFDDGGQVRRYRLEPNAIYWFANPGEQLVLRRFAFPAPADPPGDPPAGGAESPVDEPDAPATGDIASQERLGVIPVMVLADDNEATVRRLWEQRLRQRVAEASAIFERQCRIRFEVVAVGTWQSDDGTTSFPDSLREFESKVTPAPARLAIGFTSQYQISGFEHHLGITRRPLHSHILIRERSQRFTDTERLEVLVHELGHYLGAAHSPDPHSFMRPRLVGRPSRARAFEVRFDPINTYVMYLIGEEIRFRGVKSFLELGPATKERLCEAYGAMVKDLPDDPAAAAYIKILKATPASQPAPIRHPQPLVAGARLVVQAIVKAAEQNRHLPVRTPQNADGAHRLFGDRLTERLFRRGAAAAEPLPAEVAARAYLLGLGIAVDSSSVLRDSPIISQLCRQAESDEERAHRLRVLGSPTMRGRRDLAQHFVVSCALSVLIGPEATETVGILKEIRDAQGGSGFSFVDLSADLAGVTFATRLRDGDLSLKTVGSSFAVEDFLPGRGELREGIPWRTFLTEYGSAEDDRFHRQQAAIRQRILNLPGYRPPR